MLVIDFKTLLKLFQDFSEFTLFSIGRARITVGELSGILFWIIASYWLLKWIRIIFVDKFLLRFTAEKGIIAPVSNIIRAVVWSILVILVLQAYGVDLSGLKIITGALGVGIGFGLQNITNNFISGIIIIFEQPIKVGDRVEVGDIQGDVVRISIRATTIRTNDNISIIVPNSYFVSNNVINWSYNNHYVRLRFRVPVSYKEDPEHVKKVLLEVAAECSSVLTEPKPDIWFDEFGESALVFQMNVWTRDYVTSPKTLKSILYYAVSKKFKEHKIEMPYAQRDLYIKELPKNKE
jgi:small-conductance mechanosensitive channel